MSNENSSHESTWKSLEIKQQDEFFSRLSAKKGATAEGVGSSFRVYCGAKGSVPFLWESQPGTPKNTYYDSSFPPLTPPPSHYYKSREKSSKDDQSLKIVFATVSRLLRVRRNSHVMPTSSLSVSSSSPGSSSFSSVTGKHNLSMMQKFSRCYSRKNS